MKSSRRERSRPESVVAALNLGEHVTFDELVATASRAHGKPIELKEIDGSAIPSVTGLWVEKDTKSIILVPAGDSWLHRQHAVCHEFGHLLLNHHGCGRPEAPMPSMFKYIGGRMGIKRMLARSQEWTETEQDAERVAYLLGQALSPREPRSGARPSR
jgi:hypothetical protein